MRPLSDGSHPAPHEQGFARRLGYRILLILLVFGPLFAAFYPLTQFYHMEEDRLRGDRTLALLMGIRGSLIPALLMAALAFLMLAFSPW